MSVRARDLLWMMISSIDWKWLCQRPGDERRVEGFGFRMKSCVATPRQGLGGLLTSCAVLELGGTAEV